MTCLSRSAWLASLGVVTAAMLGGCAPEEVAAQEPTQLNLVLLLDLSDRIDPAKPASQHQAAIDRQVVRRIVDVFSNEVKQKRFIFSRDRVEVVVAPQPVEYQGEVVESADKLRIDVGQLPLRERRQQLPELTRELVARVDHLYDKATSSRRFVGADIWSFFRTSLEDHVSCPRPGEKTRNVLVVLTDGYLDFEDAVQQARPRNRHRTSYMQVAKYRGSAIDALRLQDHGLIAVRNDALKCVEVLLLEMRERKIGDREVLQEYWGKWLTEMGIARFELKMAGDSAGRAGDIVERFLEQS